MNSEAIRSTLRVTKALADLQRVRILMMLEPGELCVCQIVGVLELAPSTVSKHLSNLSAADLVVSRKDGRWAYYRLPTGPAGVFVRPVLKWLGASLRNDETIEHDVKKLRTVMACDPEKLCRRQRERNNDNPKK
ncbi:MAG: ArsR/SmtB family transcription factor [Kiritimatiellia bacterium]